MDRPYRAAGAMRIQNGGVSRSASMARLRSAVEVVEAVAAAAGPKGRMPTRSRSDAPGLLESGLGIRRSSVERVGCSGRSGPVRQQLFHGSFQMGGSQMARLAPACVIYLRRFP